jgi:hypothetical protein
MSGGSAVAPNLPENTHFSVERGVRIEYRFLCVRGIPTIDPGCRWYVLLLARSVNTQLALCGVLDVTGRRLIVMAGRLVVEVG